MSGEVFIVATPGSLAERAIARLGELETRLPPFALIGGLAVFIRLGQAHRATNDIDTVSDDQLGAFDVLTGAGLDRQGDSVLLETDLKLDIIDVSDGDPAYLPYLTHRFAFDTRSVVDVRVTEPDGRLLAAASVPTARTSALLAVKLSIGESVGRRRDPRKVGSDYFDIIRLLQRHGPDVVADELTSLASSDLVSTVSDLAERRLVEGADSVARALLRSATQGVQAVSVEEIELFGRALVTRLSR